ncbi:MAG: protein kinase domain-containing protein [Planctomycetota bacterium]
MTETQPPRGLFPSPAATPEDGGASPPAPPRAADDSDAEIGAQVGPYRITEKLGSGGMGVVYKCEEELLRRPVALKVIRAKYALDEHYRRRFQREARAVAALSHPALVHIYGFGEFERAGISRPYLAMEYVDGPSLEALLARRGKLTVGEAVRFARDAASGLREAFRHGVVHRDVKPSNLLVAPSGSAKVVDFGLAKELRSEGPATEDGVVLGTPHYISPEQGRGKAVDHRSDIYSLGATLYHMLAGRPPFEGESHIAVIVAHVNDEPPPLAALDSGVPEAVAKVVSKMLRKDPAERYPHYDALLEDLEALGGGREPPNAVVPAGARDQSATERLRVRSGRRRSASRLAAAALVLLALGGAVWLAGRSPSPGEPARAPLELGTWYERLDDGRDLIQARFSDPPPGVQDLGGLFLIPPAGREAEVPPQLGTPRAYWKLGEGFERGKYPPKLLFWESYRRPFACRFAFRRLDEVRVLLGPTRNLFDFGIAIVDPAGWKRRALVFRLRPADRTPDPIAAFRSLEPVPLAPLDAAPPEAVPRLGTEPVEIALSLRLEGESTLASARVARRARAEPLYEARFLIEGGDWASGVLVLQTPSPTAPFLVTVEKLAACGSVDAAFRVEEVPWRD